VNAQIELIEGTNRNHELSQFFTPPKLAAKLVEWAGIADPNRGPYSQPYRVLEPSAGNGAIVRPLLAAGAEVTAVEVDDRYMYELVRCNEHRPYDVRRWDFLALSPGIGNFDLVCGNFPFHLDLDGAFTLHALKFAPRVCAIYPANFFYSETREALWRQVRPTRVAHIAKRPWPGATDYVALELRQSSAYERSYPQWAPPVKVEWWSESWH
jgi:predicted RNA methylase